MFETLCTTHTLSAGFARVAKNRGGPGVDGVTIAQFERHLGENLDKLSCELEDRTYSPLPLLQILVAKKDGDPRKLSIPTVRDRTVQAALLNILTPLLEEEFEDCSFGYRRGRSVKQAVYRIKEYYDQGYTWVVDADIDAYFDNVDHTILMGKLRAYIHDEEIARLVELWIKAEIWDGHAVSVTDRGIPQGSPISPVLANLFLDELDEALLKEGYRIIRYADDFIILCKSPERAEDALEFTNEVLARLDLVLDEADVIDFERGFQFLGVTFVRSMIFVPFDKPKRDKKVLFYPPPLNMKAYLKNKRGRRTG
ncbi:MAG: RNA-directed DNA polymerase [Deltaproteobacteria bacterium]|nr:RNA-directed DNA polymerase [Deltaproteobacteria bacterium]